jgi:surfeit locus 1 family protein
MLLRFLPFRPLFWPTLFTVPAFFSLVALAVWQLDRLEWKNALTQTIERQLGADPVALPAGAFDVEAFRYRRVVVAGVFQHDKEMHMLAHTEKGEQGYQIITPLERDDGSIVLVNRGWVPPEKRQAAKRADGLVKGRVTIGGIVRKPWSQGLFVPDNAPQANEWFWGDLDGMAKQAGAAVYAPVFIEADRTPNPGGFPIGGQSRIKLKNDHLQYAITWFLLAAGLLVIYVVYHVQNAPAPKPEP